MDRFKQKLKKEKIPKTSPKDKYPLFITDVKTIKENIKIKEILRTVKMNSSMRLKAPPGSKVMSNKDFNEDDYFEESTVNAGEVLSATNPDVVVTETDTDNIEIKKCDISAKESTENSECDNSLKENHCSEENQESEIDNNNSEVTNESNQNVNKIFEQNSQVPNGKITDKTRDRKLSLDFTMLSRREGFSQSELDLHSIGKCPLERKSSFFRKTMDSFVRNTTEMFKRQNKSLQRRVSMSVSLQSLNDKCSSSSEYNETPTPSSQDVGNSQTSLHTASSIARSMSSLSAAPSGSCQSSTSFASSQPALHALSTPTLEDIHSNSAYSLNEACLTDAMLNSRAISMSSGLDSSHNQTRRKASRSNRVTWVASEGVTNYFRRMNQDEKTKEMQSCHSYQDFSCIPENELYGRKPDTKGRRLSYQRAVSGEDPVMSTRYQDSSLRRRHQIPENNEAHYELTNYLAEFTRHGVPALRGFEVAAVPDEAFAYLLWAAKQKNIEEFYDWQQLSSQEQARQAVIRELIHTEADYIKHLMAIVEVFIAAAHSLQDGGKMLNIETSMLFSNLPDLLNASLNFWYITLMPMIKDAVENTKPFNTDLMAPGFAHFRELLFPYEKFVVEQNKLLEYYRKHQSDDAEFAMYLSWCHSQKECNRLQLNDFLVKPMQRMTKYGLILHRIINHTETEPERASLVAMEKFAKNCVIDLNRSVRQREEIDKVAFLDDVIENYEIELKDEELENFYKQFGHVNLTAPMLYCLPTQSRTVIYEGDVRFRDSTKEIDVHVFLLTDMLLVCKKLSKGCRYQYKLIRPKYMIDKMAQFPRFVSRNSRELSGLLCVIVDDVGTPHSSFMITEPSKDPNPQLTLRTWETKMRVAKLTYELLIWSSRNTTRDPSEFDTAKYLTTTQQRPRSDDGLIEQEARERVATVLHRGMGASSEHDLTFSIISEAETMTWGISARTGCLLRRTSSASTPLVPRKPNGRPQTRIRSASHEDPRAGPSKKAQRAGGSVDRLMPPPIAPSSITVRVVSASESEGPSPQPPSTGDGQQIKQSPSRNSSRSAQSAQLRVQPQNNVATLIYSLPDLTIEPSTPRSTSSPTQPSASEKMYQSHQELLQRNRLVASQQQQYLSPDHRGSSYPPPSPTRASLKRGLAFSYSFKNPPLTKMGHVSSQSQVLGDQGPSTSQSKSEMGDSPKSGTTTDKDDKKSKLTSSRRKHRDKSEDRHSEPSTSRKDQKRYSRRGKSADCPRDKDSPSPRGDESPGTSGRDESPDPKDKSSSFSHTDETPGPSRTDESFGPSISPGQTLESAGPSHTDISHGLSSVEVSRGPSHEEESFDIRQKVDIIYDRGENSSFEYKVDSSSISHITDVDKKEFLTPSIDLEEEKSPDTDSSKESPKLNSHIEKQKYCLIPGSEKDKESQAVCEKEIEKTGEQKEGQSKITDKSKKKSPNCDHKIDRSSRSYDGEVPVCSSDPEIDSSYRDIQEEKRINSSSTADSDDGKKDKDKKNTNKDRIKLSNFPGAKYQRSCSTSIKEGVFSNENERENDQKTDSPTPGSSHLADTECKDEDIELRIDSSEKEEKSQ